MLNLSGGVITAARIWTDDGAVHEVHSLKRRAATATRPVPIPPQFVRILRAHINRFGVAPDGWVFRNQAGNYVDASAYGITRARARKHGACGESGTLVRDWSRRAGQEGDNGGRKWEVWHKPAPALSGSGERRLTGKRPVQAPFFVRLEEAELLR